jgi:hypothetical protein
MASTYTTNLKLELIPTGSQSGIWGATTNVNLGSSTATQSGLEQAIVGKASLVTGDFAANVATYTLSDSNAYQVARAFVLDVTATLSGAGTINVPAIQKPYLVFNNSVGGFAITVKVSGQTGVSIPNGKKVWLYNNGTDVGVAFDYAPSLTLGTALPVLSGGTGVTTSTGTGSVVLSNSPTLVTPSLGTPTSATLTNATGLPLTTGVTGTLPTGSGGTGVNSYTAGDITYYAAGTALTKLPIGANTFILTSTGAAPQWVSPSTVPVGTATNLAGGTVGAVPYQSGVGTTAFLPLGTTNFVLTAGTSGPQYVAQNTLTVGSVVDIAGGSANQIVYQSGAGVTSFAIAPTGADVGKVLSWSGTTFTWAAAPAATTASNIAGGTTGDLVYQSGVGASSFISDVATGNALISGGVGVAPSYGKIGLTTHVSGVLPTANGGTNLSSFTSGTAIYASSTSTLASGTLPTTGGGTGLTSFTSGGAVYATSTSALTTGTLPIAGGGTNSTSTPTAGAVAYGTGTAFAFSTSGSPGEVLYSNGASAPFWGTAPGTPASKLYFFGQF